MACELCRLHKWESCLTHDECAAPRRQRTVTKIHRRRTSQHDQRTRRSLTPESGQRRARINHLPPWTAGTCHRFPTGRLVAPPSCGRHGNSATHANGCPRPRSAIQASTSSITVRVCSAIWPSVAATSSGCMNRNPTSRRRNALNPDSSPTNSNHSCMVSARLALRIRWTSPP